MAVVVGDQDAQALPVEVVWHLVQLPARAEVEAAEVADGLVDRVDQAGLERGVEVGVAEHLLALLALQVQRRADAHDAFGERTGLVGTEHVHAAEVLDGREAPDDHLAERHAPGAVGEVDADDRGQQLRRQADRHGQREDERLEDGAVEVHVDRENRNHEHERHLHEEVPEAPDAVLEFRLRGAKPQPLRHLAELGPHSSAHDDGHGAAADDVRAHEERVGPLAEGRVRREDSRCLGHRIGLSCQGGLIEEQALRLEQQAVTGNALAR